MKIAGFGNSSGAKYWRLIDPFTYMAKHGIDARVIETGINEQVAQWADVYTLQGCVDKEGIALLYTYQKERGKKIVVDVDDRLEIEEDNPHLKEHIATNAPEVLKVTLEIADMVTTTNEYLAEKLRKYNKNVAILPNYMSQKRWDVVPKLKNDSQTLRIGWAGSLTHLKDLLLIEKPLKELCREFPHVKLIFVGEPRVMDHFKWYNAEFFPGVPFEAWPERLNGLRLDIGLAPLVNNDFNRCKSNIKWQEYAINKIPGIFSHIVYDYRGFDGYVAQIAETQHQWYQALKNLIVSKNLRDDIANSAYAMVVSKFTLEKNIQKYIKAYKSLQP